MIIKQKKCVKCGIIKCVKCGFFVLLYIYIFFDLFLIFIAFISLLFDFNLYNDIYKQTKEKTMKTSETKKREIANMLIESMETAGTGFMLPWVKSGMPMNLSSLNTKDPYYYGINNLILWREKSFNKYKSNV